ncbi:MAG: BLUF domain-containing protein [Phenylobacterium sp.]|uniref:BLUF domain-containing protein n=1 Tax=Phenylobacterium sp. TaxID=1871053 RepID=UPI001A5C0072|nr:BLUF domain-containing protein [Phenylobacterium sp.]MBL8770925.1 BLUF domain-containing protein [Phenylobacterium sp.]
MWSARSALTGEQIRAGRALMRIEQTELARLSGLSLETIKRLERTHGPVEANSRTVIALTGAFADLGVVFDICESGLGVCRLPPGGAPVKPGRGRTPARTSASGGLCRLIYHSICVDPRDQTEAGLARIVDVAAPRNLERGVTGALLACDGRFLQALEGPDDVVLRVFGAISCDPRHSNITVVERRSIAGRNFADWPMCHGVIAADDEVFAREPALRDGFRPDSLSPATALGLLTIVRDRQGDAADVRPAASTRRTREREPL